MTGFQFVTVEAGIIGRGASESFLGEVLAQRPRSSYILATKVYFPMSAKDLGIITCTNTQANRRVTRAPARGLSRSLSMPSIRHGHPYRRNNACAERRRESGEGAVHRVQRVDSPRQIEGAFAVEGSERFVSSQAQYSLLWRQPEEKIIPLCAANGISQIVWSPLAQGVLSGKYMAKRSLQPRRAPRVRRGWSFYPIVAVAKGS